MHPSLYSVVKKYTNILYHNIYMLQNNSSIFIHIHNIINHNCLSSTCLLDIILPKFMLILPGGEGLLRPWSAAI